MIVLIWGGGAQGSHAYGGFLVGKAVSVGGTDFETDPTYTEA